MSDTFTHSSGTAHLVNADPIVDQTQYQLTYTITGRTVGSITITFGGVTTGPVSASGLLIATTENNTERFTVTPTSNFDGTCTFSLRTINHYRDSCQWTDLVNCIENCGVDDIYSPGLWYRDDIGLGVTNLRINTSNEYYIASEYIVGSETLCTVRVNKDIRVYVIFMEDVVLFEEVEGGLYDITYSISEPTSPFLELLLSYLIEDQPLYEFNISGIRVGYGPLRTFEPIACSVFEPEF